MKVVLSGGGTGGHIYPALTIAGALRRLDPACEITFVGTRKGLEKDIIPRYGYPLEFINVAGFERHLGLGTLKSAGELLLGRKEAYSLLNRIDPDLVIGTGGYVCGPILFWAAMKRVPTCIQEQNAMPGVTNKILSRFVDDVFRGYLEVGRYFASHAKKLFTGNPVRREILEATREEGLKKFGLDPDKTTLLAFGGSRGARTINQAMVAVEQQLAGNSRIQILHATGTVGYEKHAEALGDQVLHAGNIHVVPYLHDMPLALAAADLLERQGVRTEVLKLNQISPLEYETLAPWLAGKKLLAVAEDDFGAGCVGQRTAAILAQHGQAPEKLVLINLGKTFLPEGTVPQLEHQAGIDAAGIARAVQEART